MISLRPGEKIYLIKRRHRFILAVQLFFGFLFFLVIAILMLAVFSMSTPETPDWLTKIFPELLNLNLKYILIFLLSLLLPIFWQIIFLTVADYYLDCWIVTNERIICTELVNLFNRVESSVPLDKIQDITIDVKGMFPTFLNFGDVHVETAGQAGAFVLRQIPDPEKTKEIIFKAQKEFLKTLGK